MSRAAHDRADQKKSLGYYARVGSSEEWRYIQEIISANVATELQARRWTQRMLAGRSGIPETQISRLLRGRTDWWLRDMWRIAKALGVPIDDLLRLPDEAPEIEGPGRLPTGTWPNGSR